MGEEQTALLQRDIDQSLAARGWEWLSIRLDRDADVLDLSQCVDVLVKVSGENDSRTMAIRAYDSLKDLMQGGIASSQYNEDEIHYCVGGPLCIVAKISGSSVVSVVHRYLSQERAGRLP